MSRTDLVRDSRSGDQFHYLWAARRCLRLLDPALALKAVMIEGVSPNEGHSEEVASAGEEVVDIAEYYGGEAFGTAEQVIYRQLKHSTRRVDKAWSPSELTKTINGFAKKHHQLVKVHGEAEVTGKVTYHLVTNRAVSSNIRESISRLALAQTPTHKSTAERLTVDASLPAELIQGFFASMRLEDTEAKFRDQEGLLATEFSDFLAGEDLDAAKRLRTYISDKAASKESESTPVYASDVLAELRVGPDKLFPAPSYLEIDSEAVPREQEQDIGQRIREAADPVLILAPGGVGKSVLATRLPSLMPDGSASVVFDCFANGDYRRLSQHRHLHERGLVQIANELSRAGLCLPLLPTTGATAQDYMRGLLGRLQQAREAVRANGAEALVLVVVDAADNAQTAAEEAGAQHAFVRDLIRERMPEGVRLVMLCRPERADKLQAPPNVMRVPLEPFTRGETAALLRKAYPEATETEVDQFHRLSSQNPRVQANALSVEPDLGAVLRSLGPNPTTVEAAIGAQLQAAVDRLRHEAGPHGGDIDILCSALAALRPMIPLTVLSTVSGLSGDEVRSFASDLGKGRWLWLGGDALQFRDEPAETWFRKTFSATPEQLRAFIDRLKPLADRDGYAAATLPSLMLEGGLIDELVALAVSDNRLPADRPFERREIAVERLRFAFRAAISAERWADAAKLAQKAGQETAGQSRHETLLEQNTDLVGVFLDGERLQEISARGKLDGGNWFGSRYAYEAALLSAKTDLRGEALNRLSTSLELLNAWARRVGIAEDVGEVSDEDRAEFIWALLNLKGSADAIAYVVRWRRRRIWFDAMLIVARRLVDHGRFEDLDALALQAIERRAAPVIAAVSLALSEIARNPPTAAVKYAFENMPASRGKTTPYGLQESDRPSLRSAIAIAEAVTSLKCAKPAAVVAFLNRWLPKVPSRNIREHVDSGRTVLLRGYALRAALRGRELQLVDVAPEDLRERLARGAEQGRSSEEIDFHVRVGSSLPWWMLRARWLVDAAKVNLDEEADQAETVSKRARGHYEDQRSVFDEIAVAYLDVVARSQPDALRVERFVAWLRAQRRHPCLPTLTRMTRLAGRTTALYGKAHEWAQSALDLETDVEGEGASSRVESIVHVSRALLSLDPEEAQAVFDKAVDVASRFGDEAFARWKAALALAERAGVPTESDPKLAHRLALSAEFAKTYIEDHFPWSSTVSALVALAPTGAIATVSRWRDRGFGWHKDLFTALWRHLQERSLGDPLIGPALLGFQYGFLSGQLLERALAAAKSKAEREMIYELFAKAIIIGGASAEDIRAVRKVAVGQGIDATALEAPLKAAGAAEATEKRTWPGLQKSAAEMRNWRRRLAKVKVATFSEAMTAQKTFYGSCYERDVFWSAMIAQLPPQNLAAFVRDAFGSDTFEVYDIQAFIEALPAVARKRQAISNALKSGAVDFLRRECWRVVQPYAWSWHRIETTCQWSGLDIDEAVRITLQSIGENASRATGEDYFHVVWMLAKVLSQGEARASLDYGLTLIEAVMPDDFGEGGWRTSLEPPPEVDLALAGLLWATLGDIRPDIRWQASHVVRDLVRLNRQKLVGELLRWAARRTAGPFGAESLGFYVEEARHHLMLGLARGALDTPAHLAAHASAILDFGRRSEPNVIVRHYAAQARLALAGVAPISPELEGELRTVNAPKVVTRRDEVPEIEAAQAATEEDDKFTFDYELGKGPLSSLARAFFASDRTLNRAAAGVIHKEWGLIANGHWDQEPRRNQRIMNGRTRRDGTVDTWSAYLSFHASCVVAGRWLDQRPVRISDGDNEDDFTDWLKYRLLTRDDNRWVADRRDAAMTHDFPSISRDLWPWSVQRKDFGEVLGIRDQLLTVWENRLDRENSLVQRREVRSALVPAETAGALLAAAQTVQSPYDLFLPSIDNDLDVNTSGPFALQPWVDAYNRELRSDETDPWAGRITYPGPRPARWLIQRLGLAEANDGRVWLGRGKPTPVFTAAIWGTARRMPEDEWPAHGATLAVRRRSLRAMLKRLKKDLIVTVEITRSLTDRQSYWREDDDFYVTNEYFMSFLFRQDGSVETLF